MNKLELYGLNSWTKSNNYNKNCSRCKAMKRVKSDLINLICGGSTALYLCKECNKPDLSVVIPAHWHSPKNGHFIQYKIEDVIKTLPIFPQYSAETGLLSYPAIEPMTPKF